jgi:glutathione S-transferase
LKFYDCREAPSPRRVRIFAAEKGIELDTVEVDLRGGEQFGAAFRAINPDCVVPVLELDDGTRISEVLAICDYLEALHPEPPLFGRRPEDRALAMMWNFKVEQQGLWPVAEAFRNATPGLEHNALPGPEQYEQIAELVPRSRRRAAAFLAKLDGQLDGREFITGDDFTIADISALVVVDFAQRLKIRVEQPTPNLDRWHGTVSARPSAAA